MYRFRTIPDSTTRENCVRCYFCESHGAVKAGSGMYWSSQKEEAVSSFRTHVEMHGFIYKNEHVLRSNSNLIEFKHTLQVRPSEPRKRKRAAPSVKAKKTKIVVPKKRNVTNQNEVSVLGCVESIDHLFQFDQFRVTSFFHFRSSQHPLQPRTLMISWMIS